MTIEETLQIALDAHKGQKDLDGKPAILHPIAVGLMGSNDAVYRIAHSGNYTAIHTKINDLKHNFDRGRKSYRIAKELNDTEKAERLSRINGKHQKALNIFGYIPLYNSLESIDF